MPEYKLKRVTFDGRAVQLLCQNENGPCPLIAIVNVLLLKGLAELPKQPTEVPESTLLALVAGYILDRHGGKEDPNVRQIVQDTITLLPKLTTGVDVNLKFSGCESFEFTAECGVFDLVGCRLLHGWVVDHQDVATASAFGTKSYNDVLDLLVAAMGDARSSHGAADSEMSRKSLPELLSSLRATASRAQDAEAGAHLEPAPSNGERHGAQPPPTPPAQSDVPTAVQNVDQMDPELAQALAMSLETAHAPEAVYQPPDALEPVAASAPVAATRREAAGENHVVDLEPEAVAGHETGADVSVPQPTPTADETDDRDIVVLLDECVADVEAEEQAAEGLRADEADGQVSSQPHGTRDAAVAADSVETSGSVPAGTAVVASAWQDVASASTSEHVSELGSSVFAAPVHGRPGTADANNVETVRLIQEFLYNNSSQLTVAGLCMLHDTMKDQELAVFFRNNHFSTLYKRDKALWCLVTDQGYHREGGVVWEKLDNVEGDTTFYSSDFVTYKQHVEKRQAETAEYLAQLALAEEAEKTMSSCGEQAGTSTDFASAALPAAVAQPVHTTQSDHDLALAIHLQEEERAQAQRADEERARRNLQQAAAQGPARPPAPQSGNPSAAQSGRVDGPPLNQAQGTSGARATGMGGVRQAAVRLGDRLSGRSSGSGGGQPEGNKRPDCVIM